MEPAMPSWYSQNSFGEPISFDNYDKDAAVFCVSTPSSTQCTPLEDTSDEHDFLADLNTPSYSIEDGVSETGPMTDFLMSDLVSPRSADRMATVFAAFVDEEEPSSLSTSDHLGINEVNASTHTRDSILRLARPGAQSTVYYNLLDMTIDVIRYLTRCRLHTDRMANRRNDLS